MLHKSFKSAKCKTALRLATSRIKLMKNKKVVQMNQMKRDLAQLLETGQDRTARIRVEHVIREEKMVAAYELIEIYCELIVARLPIIESQKTCPIDLKEAVTSVIFAAPRCSDISELSDIKKQFTAKYGKEFVTAAIELRPDCGVSRMLVEKLSAVAPNVQTKVKVLSDVAKEHNIEWDPTSFEEKESKPPNDLLNGPSNIEKASIPITNLPKIQPINTNDDHSHEDKQNACFDFAEQNRRYTLGTQNVNSTDGVGTSSFATHQDTSSSGINSERTKNQQPDFRGEHDFSSGRESWNMEFKDATSAAHAAAESAERAAMAARAAAQFSNQEKIAKQRQTGSRVSNIKDENPQISKDSYESSSHGRKHKIKNQHIDQSQHENSQKADSQFSSHEKIVKEHPSGSYVSNIRDETPYVSKNLHETYSSDKNKKPNQHIDLNRHDISQKAAEGYHGASHRNNIRSDGPNSFRSDHETIDNEKLVNDFHIKDGYFEESMHEEQEAASSPAIVDLGSGQKESFENENICIFAEATKNKSSIHSSSSSDEADSSKRNVVGNLFKEATNANSNVVSQREDEPISDDDDIGDDGPRFDSGGFDYDEVEATQSLENAHIWSPKRNTFDKLVSQSHLFSKSLSFGEHSVKSMEPSEADDHVASFDHSDGPDSESESELIPIKPEPSYVESSHNFDSQKSRIELNDLVEDKPSFDNPEHEEKRPQSQHELKKHDLDHESYNILEDNSNYQPNDFGLNFGTLTGGFRNKGGIPYPPYTKSVPKDSLSMSKKSIEESSATGGQTFSKSSLDSKMSKPNVSILSSDSDSDSDLKSRKHANTRSQFSPPAAFINDDESAPGLKVPKQVPSRVHLGSWISRRTRGSPSVSYSKTHIEPEGKTVIPSFSENSSEYSYSNEVPAEPRVSESQPFSSSRTEIGSTKTQQRSGKQSFDYRNETKTVEKKPEAKIPSYKPVSSRIAVESGKTKTMKADKLPGEDAVKKPSHVHVSSRIAVESGETKTTKADKLSGENAVKKPSHVHPKLPDYESLAARLQSLRNNDH